MLPAQIFQLFADGWTVNVRVALGVALLGETLFQHPDVDELAGAGKFKRAL